MGAAASALLLLVGAQGGGEQKSIETPKVASLREEQAKRDAVWKPVRHPAAPHFGPARGATDPPTHCQMDLQAFAKLAKLRGVERSGLSNEVRL